MRTFLSAKILSHGWNTDPTRIRKKAKKTGEEITLLEAKAAMLAGLQRTSRHFLLFFSRHPVGVRRGSPLWMEPKAAMLCRAPKDEFVVTFLHIRVLSVFHRWLRLAWFNG
jgi:hypothetical protein